MITPSSLVIKLLVGAVLLSISFYSGWRTNAAFTAEAELAEANAEKQITEEFKKFETSISDKLETRLQELRANERVIEREKIKVVESNPVVYNVECLDAAGLQLIERARTGKSNSVKPAQ